jgi:hypothetical protein
MRSGEGRLSSSGALLTEHAAWMMLSSLMMQYGGWSWLRRERARARSVLQAPILDGCGWSLARVRMTPRRGCACRTQLV